MPDFSVANVRRRYEKQNPDPDNRIPNRQILASHDSNFITLYTCFPAEIANPAVEQQRLDASPKFSFANFTWLRPSWCSIIFQTEDATKDPSLVRNPLYCGPTETRILALQMTHEKFAKLLSDAEVIVDRKPRPCCDVTIQWDPARNRRKQVLPYRSIAVKVLGQTADVWVKGWIEKIEDVTAKAGELKEAVDMGCPIYDLADRGLMPVETEYQVSEERRQILLMDEWKGKSKTLIYHDLVDKGLVSMHRLREHQLSEQSSTVLQVGGEEGLV